MMTANYLVTNFGFKRKTKNKEKLLVNDEYGITLKSLDGRSASFIDINTGKEYYDIGDIITKFALEEIERGSKRFNEGLPERNLRQGNFDEAYKENRQKDEFFISHDKAKKLLNAQFNRHISSSLMCSGNEPNYNYYIKEAKYEFRNTESNNEILTLYYNYKDRKGHHYFWMTHDIYAFDKDNFYVNHRVGSKIPLDLIIEKFLK
jgi:hypothetical protein